MSEKLKSYIAGFLDGDGCIMAQLVRRKDYVYGYQVRLSVVFYQKSNHRDHLEWLKTKLHYGYIRNRNDGMSEYTIVGLHESGAILKELLPYLRLKKALAKIAIRIAKMPKKPTIEELLTYAAMVDVSAEFNYSKKRTNRTSTIQAFLKEHLPVTTDSQLISG